jgi:hypothetical protein
MLAVYCHVLLQSLMLVRQAGVQGAAEVAGAA